MNHGLAFGLTSLLAGALGIALMQTPIGSESGSPALRSCGVRSGERTIRRALDMACGLDATLDVGAGDADRGATWEFGQLDALQQQLLLRLVDVVVADCDDPEAAARWRLGAPAEVTAWTFEWRPADDGERLVVAGDGLRIDCERRGAALAAVLRFCAR